jgi:uncharacterized protein (DUF427 family)
MAQTRTWFQGISETNINVRGSAVVVGQLDVDIPSSGYVEVHFDGICVADVGDRIVLAASDIPDWGPNDGNVSVEAVNTDINTIPFSHTRVYPVTAGSQSFYAVAQNYVEIDGSGIASIYASLTVRFFPDNPGSASVAFQGIDETGINVRGNPVAVGHITLNTSSAGKAVVHFDGMCVADVGDRIVLAASDTPDWSPDDGNVTVEAVNTDINSASFSHTRVYDISAGSHDFYAVAQNYVEMDGSGIASIYGSLTVEFFPAQPDSAFADFQGIDETGINVRGNPVTLGQITVNAPSSGKVVVHFDGMCLADVGDRIVLAASDTPDWSPNDGSVTVEAVNTDINGASFSHTRVYNVSAGSHDFYAVAQNYVEMDGSGIASIYGSLTVEFFPGAATGVKYNGSISADFSLEQNYPNPFNPSTKIKYRIPELSFVKLTIYDALGDKIKTLVNEEKSAGEYTQEFKALNLPSGIYFYQLQAGLFTETKKMVLMR